MNEDILKGKWNQLKGEVKSWWGFASGDIETELEGGRDKLVGMLQEKKGMAKEEAEKEVSRFHAAIDKMENRLEEVKAKIVDKWEDFSEDDLQDFKGSLTDLGEKIKAKYNATEDQVQAKIKELMDKFDDED